MAVSLLSDWVELGATTGEKPSAAADQRAASSACSCCCARRHVGAGGVAVDKAAVGQQYAWQGQACKGVHGMAFAGSGLQKETRRAGAGRAGTKTASGEAVWLKF